MPSNHPVYVQRWGRIGAPQPFLLYKVEMHGFAFPGSMRALRGLCDRYLNLDPHRRVVYEPFARHVLLTFSTIEWVTSENQRFRNKGGIHEWELAIWVAVRRRGTARILLYTPYVFVDNSPAIPTGREIYGFPKEAGQFDKGGWASGDRFSVEAYSLPHFGATALMDLHGLLEVKRTQAAAATQPAVGGFEDVAALLQQALLERLPAAAAHEAAPMPPSGLWPPHGPLVFLKQFPEAAATAGACYQGVVEADMQVTALRGFKLFGSQYQLRLPHIASHPLHRDLGLVDGAEADLQYWVDFDARLTAGKEVWRVTPGAATEYAPSVSASSLLAALWETPTALGSYATETGRALWNVGQGVTRVFLESPSEAVGAIINEGPLAFGKRALDALWAALADAAQAASGRKQKIAILGGGVGAVAAAFALTDTEGWQDRYEITLYQIGWRLGGKGASGRNHQIHDRIEEHGVHAWFGFYHNAFAMMRKCYTELTGDADAWKKAFKPHDYIVLEERSDNGWEHWPIIFPPQPGKLLTPWEYVVEIVRWLRDVVEESGIPRPAAEVAPADAPAPSWHALEARIGTPSRPSVRHPSHHMRTALNLALSLDRDAHTHTPTEHDWLSTLLGEFRDWRGEPPSDDPEARRRWIFVDLAIAMVRGMIADGVLLRGFDAIDNEDFRAWLARHGASKASRQSAYVSCLYSLAFAFPGGDATHEGDIAAGTTVRGLMRMLFAYDGKFMWKMQAGMGDIVFAPFYEVLKHRGVHFKFFHRVRKLHLSKDKRSIERISIGRQARPKRGEYRPLVRIKGWQCWPNEPDYSQLVEGADILKLKRRPGTHVNLESSWSSWGPDKETPVILEHGKDFDKVVLAISLGAFEDICEELIKAHGRWLDMVRTVKTVRTQSFQLWLDRDLKELGWDRPGPLSTAYVEPIDTWAEMNQTLPAENWPEGQEPKLVAYFCGVMPDERTEQPQPYSDPSFPAKCADAVRVEMDDYLKTRVRYLWPRFHMSDIRTELHVANIDPTERYVQSLSGTVDERLPAERSGFDNLFLAGDWTRNGLNGGCVEGAVMSGLQAARGVSGRFIKVIGESDFE